MEPECLLSVDTIRGLEEVKKLERVFLSTSVPLLPAAAAGSQGDLNRAICFPLFCSAPTGQTAHHEGHRGKSDR